MLVSFWLEGQQDSEQEDGSGWVFFLEEMFMMRNVVLVSEFVDGSEMNEEGRVVECWK